MTFFHQTGNELYYEDRLVGTTQGLSFASGEPVAQYACPEDMTGVALAPLPGSDLLFVARGQTFGVERKTWSDLCTSRWSGHLTEQLGRMLEQFDVTLLCMETEVIWRHKQSSHDINMSDSMQTMLLDWQDLGVRMIQTANMEHTVDYVRKLHKKYATRTASEPVRQPKRLVSVPIEIQMLMRIPGIGVKTAERLLEKYGTLRNLLATYEKPSTLKDGAISKKILKAMRNEGNN